MNTAIAITAIIAAALVTLAVINAVRDVAKAKHQTRGKNDGEAP